MTRSRFGHGAGATRRSDTPTLHERRAEAFCRGLETIRGGGTFAQVCIGPRGSLLPNVGGAGKKKREDLPERQHAHPHTPRYNPCLNNT